MGAVEVASKTKQPPNTVTVAEFADEMGWDHSTVLRAIRSGRVKAENEAADGLKRVKAYYIPISEMQRIRDEAAEAKRLRNEAQSRQGE